MIIKINHDRCNGCEQCIEACPVSVILKEDVIKVDNSRCIKCRTCLVSCPSNAIYIK
ncbi:4Fe-4S binding protein [Wukongibacter baidiensis]|uniref:4Fe-4S binding protein n=1 Tax=Wukongibacter baidiensis TaxID=1723361 RepID=UPI003D7FAE63